MSFNSIPQLCSAQPFRLGVLSKNSNLKVEKFKKDELPKLKQLIGEWEEELEAKIELSENLTRGLEKLEDANTIISKIWSKVFFLNGNTPNFQMLKCVDSSGNIQAIATYQRIKNSYRLNYLVTHPSNIKCAVNSKSANTRGAGTEIISYLADKVINKGREELFTSPLNPSVVSFYTQLHFQYNGLALEQLVLTREKILSLGS
jgi:hypothetical protein